MYFTHVILCYLSLKQDFIALVVIPPLSFLFCLALFCLTHLLLVDQCKVNLLLSCYMAIRCIILWWICWFCVQSVLSTCSWWKCVPGFSRGNLFEFHNWINTWIPYSNSWFIGVLTWTVSLQHWRAGGIICV